MTSGGLGLNEGLGQDISQEELDFSDLFLYNSSGDDFPNTYDKDGSGPLLQNHNQLATAQDLSSHHPTGEHLSGAVFESLGISSRPEVVPALSPRIEITLLVDSHGSQPPDVRQDPKALGDYRECVSPASSSSSNGWPAEAYSPVASPCVSPPNRACGMGLSSLDLCLGLQGIHTSSAHSSPGASPRNSITDETFLAPKHWGAALPNYHQRSRSASPHGKRSYDQAHSCQGGTPIKQRSRSPSPIPSPHEQQESFYPTEYHPQAETQPVVQSSTLGLEEILNTLSSSRPIAGASAALQDANLQAQRLDCVYGEGYDWVIEQKTTGSAATEVTSEPFCMLPAVWPRHPAHHTPFCPTLPSIPPLEHPLPSQSGHFELLIQQQPRSHHRAHYETEGSRGAVKTSNGGNPEVQLCGYQGTAPLGLQVYIGTADERLLKPHAFYQVHRITGKTVTTPSMERMMNGTKVLEIPLEPKNHMRVVIDCVGILKLRNADIELRNGETDIGRKNTRVRLVFRVHIPQPRGHLLSLQVASEPIECSQRSAQEIPAVERQDLDCCSALGGQQMVLTGQNFTSDSKVIFSEKTQEGKQLWEVEAAVDRDKTQATMLFVEIPPYRSNSISKPAKVNFYVVNGKKKRSQPQHFIYTPVIAIKSEPVDDYQMDSYSMKSLCHHLEQDSNLQALNISPALYHPTTVEPRAHVLTTDLLEEPSVHYQSRVGPLINRPLLYHAANSHYSSCSAAVLNSSLLASHCASITNQCNSASAPGAKLAEGPHTSDLVEAGLMSRHLGFVQTALPLVKSSPSRYAHEQAQGKEGSWVELGDEYLIQIGSTRRQLEEQGLERVIVKQENYYLEDVNEIIKRDLKGRNGEQS